MLLSRLAVLNVALHIAGLVLAVVGIRAGTPAAPLAERMAYLAERPFAWSFAWSVWIGCAVCMIAFAIAVAHRLRESAGWSRLAVVVLVVAGAFDLLGDSLNILVLPQAAATQPTDLGLFLLAERVTQIVGVIVANTLYALGTLLLTLALRAAGQASRAVTATGWGVFVFGLLLSAGGVTGVPWHIEWATGPTIVLYCVWVLLVARSLSAGGAAA